MQRKFDGQVVIVSGSSGGLGLAYAKFLASNGASVLLNGTTDRVSFAAAEIAGCGGQVRGFKADVGSLESCRQLVREAVDRWGRVDVVINNAGNEPNQFERSIEGLDASDLESAFRVNVGGTYNLTLAVWAQMRKQGGGRILNVASGHMFGSYGDFGLIPHAIAKSAIVGLTKAFACAGRLSRIRVNAIFPAALDTNSNRGSWDLSPEDLAEMASLAPADMVSPVVAALVDSSSAITGEMFSSCNQNVTRVFIGDTSGHNYLEYASVESCLQACLREPAYEIPTSIGEFFGRHLAPESMDRLSLLQQRHRRPQPAQMHCRESRATGLSTDSSMSIQKSLDL